MSNNARNNFPTEFLPRILEYACADYALSIPFQHTDPLSVYAGVSATWKKIIFSTPTLWTTLHFVCHPGIPGRPFTLQEAREILQQFNLSASRSRTQPLSIKFDMVFNAWPFSLVNNIIIPNIDRIRELTCPIYTNTEIYQFLAIPEGRVKLLETIDIGFMNTISNPTSAFPLDACQQFSTLRNAPRLRNVALRLVNNIHPFCLQLSFHQLVELDLGTMAMGPGLLVKILRCTPNLEKAFFYVHMTRLVDPQRKLSKSKITMKALKSLRLRLVYPSKDKRLFSTLKFPALEHIWIELYDYFQIWNMRQYTQLLSASSKTLKILVFSDFLPMRKSGFSPNNTHSPSVLLYRYRPTSHYELEKFFTRFSALEKICFSVGISIHATTIDKIGRCELLPRLSALDFGAVDGGHILSMVKERLNLVTNSPLGPPNSSQNIETPCLQWSAITYLHIIIPQERDDKAAFLALVEQAKTLKPRGVICWVDTTQVLPLPLRRGK